MTRISQKILRTIAEKSEPRGIPFYGNPVAEKFYTLFDSDHPGIYTNIEDVKMKRRNTDVYCRTFSSLAEAEAFYEQWASTAVAYTDGSYFHERGRYSYGAAIFHGGGEYHLAGRPNDPEMGRYANLAGEADAVAETVEFCKKRGVKKLKIIYDFQQIPDWVAGKSSLPVAKRLHNRVYGCAMDIEFIKVKSHSGNKGNNKADYLAKSVLLPPRNNCS